jgi:hypothetical protein
MDTSDKNVNRQTDEYWRAYERWKAVADVDGIDAANRPSREDLHDRQFAALRVAQQPDKGRG